MLLLEAIQLLTQIVQDCTTLDGSTIMLVPPKPEISVAEGYRIRITKGLEIDKETLLCVENFVKIRGLTCFEEDHGLIIYRK